jgi:1-acyl-sn-glycerol-3-phosphate acyltransferase
VGRSSDIFVNLLNNNKIVGLFPEGGRAPDGRLSEFRRGAAMLSYKTGRPIVPCAITGACEALPMHAKFPKLWSRITVKIGRPQYLLKEFDDIIDDVRLQEGTLRLKNAIAEMMYAG